MAWCVVYPEVRSREASSARCECGVHRALLSQILASTDERHCAVRKLCAQIDLVKLLLAEQNLVDEHDLLVLLWRGMSELVPRLDLELTEALRATRANAVVLEARPDARPPL